MNFNELKAKGRKVFLLLKNELWEINLDVLPFWRRTLLGFARMTQIMFQGLRSDDLLVHASALTFSTLMSLVPILAIAFSMLKGLGAGEAETARLVEWTENMPDSFQLFVTQMLDTVNRTNFAALGWISVIILFLTVVQMLGSIERAFNRIWGVSRARNFLRKSAYYISIAVVVPILILAAGTVSASLRSELLVERLGLLRWMPFLATWTAFSFLYCFMPNLRVRGGPALLSGLFGAILWMLWQRTYIGLQFGVARYNAIYGTFASVPIFLAWLYISWVIVLLGAELTFAAQNYSNASLDLHAYRASARIRLTLALSALKQAAQSLVDGAAGFRMSEYVKHHRIPVRVLQDVVTQLCAIGYLAETAESAGCYLLRISPERVAVADIIERLLSEEGSCEGVQLRDVDPSVASALECWQRGGRESMANQKLADLLES